MKALHNRLKATTTVLICLLLVSCASTPRNFTLLPPEGTEPILFPDADTPARYQYLGDLIGEYNFPHIDTVKEGFWQKLLTSLTGVNRQKEQKLLLKPVNGMMLKDGNILVADAGRHAIYKFDINEKNLEVWKSISNTQKFTQPVGMSPGPGDSILISDAVLGEVYVFNQEQKLLLQFGKGIFKRPTGIAYHEASNKIFVSDTGAHKILVFNSKGEQIDTLAIKDEANSLNRPTFLAISGKYLYVSDTMNARIVKLTLEGELVDIIGKRGYFLGDLNKPKGIAVDSKQHLYVVESYFDHLLVYNDEGQLLLPLGGTGNGAGEFYLPSGVWIDNKDRIFVADMANGRVSVFQYLGTE